MSINKTSPTTDVSDRPAREVGRVRIVEDYQDDTLRLILQELRKVSFLLSVLADEEIDVDDMEVP